MTSDRHKHGGLSWHPPGELSAWARDEAQRRGVKLSSLLTDALSAYREACAGGSVEPTAPRKRPGRRPHPAPTAAALARERAEDKRQDECPHPPARVLKGLCGACGTYVG